MTLEEVDECYKECVKRGFGSTVYSPLWNLVKELYLWIQESVPKEVQKEEIDEKEKWFNIWQMYDRYPILKPKSYETFARHAQKKENFCRRDEVTKIILINPYYFFQYIVNNKENFRVPYKRLVKNNYFGYQLKEGEENGQAD